MEYLAGAFELGGVNFDAAGGFFLFAADGHGFRRSCGTAGGYSFKGYGILGAS